MNPENAEITAADNAAKVRFTLVSDPMMGLAWECEPLLRRLETHFAGRLETHHMMSVLVRDVADFVNPSDLRLGLAEAISRYLPRLASIYMAEEHIAGMPIRMDGFAPEATPEALKTLLARRPAMHSEEIGAAFAIENVGE